MLLFFLLLAIAVTDSAIEDSTKSPATTQLLPSIITGSAPKEGAQDTDITDSDTEDSAESPATIQLLPSIVTGSARIEGSQDTDITDFDTEDSAESPATTQLLPSIVTGSAPTEGSQDTDTGYMILKVDFLLPALVDLENIKQQLLNEVEEILRGSFPIGSFQLKWVSYEL